MSIPIPTERTGDFNLTEREWLRRLRGTTLGQLADSANQLCFRQGFNCINKVWTYAIDRTDKSSGGGNVMWDINLFASANVEYFVDIPRTHPAATQLGVILTYMAPNDLEDDLTPSGTLGSAGQSAIRVRLKNASGTALDPPPSSSNSWAVIMSGSEMPSPRVINSETNVFEFESSGDVSFSRQGSGEHGYSANIVRSFLYLDRGTIGTHTAPRRIGYGTAAGTSQHVYLEFSVDYAALLEATVFEVPKLFA
tara:strand:+ start:8791 stop:9546 length:756 start_codon:yes stop_codon:yes gene_type:complete